MHNACVPVRPWTRWYESDANLVRLVRNLRQSPTAIRHIIAQRIIEHANSHRFRHMPTQAPRQLGAEAHLGLLKSMGRKRWYDKDKYLYKAFNCLYTMQPGVRSYLAQQMNDIVDVLTSYKQLATQWQLPLQEPFMQELASLCQEESTMAATDRLKDWENTLLFSSRGAGSWRRQAL